MRNFDIVNRLLFVVIVLVTMLVGISILYTFLTFGVLGLIGALIMAPLSIGLVLKFFRANTVVVTEGTVQVVERLGAFSRILYPGSSFLLDPFDKVSRTIEAGEQSIVLSPREVLVGSSATIDFQMLVRYRILRREVDGREIADEQAVYRAAYEAENWQDATRRQAEATVRDVLGETGLRDEFIGITPAGDTVIARPRSRLNAKVRFLLDRETRRWGVTITRVSVQVTHIDMKILDSVYAIRRALRDAELARINSQSEKEVRVRLAEAELAKIQMQAAAIQEGLPTVDFVALKWIEAIERLAQDPQAKWVIPVEFLETVRQITGAMSERRGPAPLSITPPPPPEDEPPPGERA